MIPIFLLLLKPRPTDSHSDYPDCSDLSTYRIYGGNTSHKGLSNRQGFDNSDMSECDISGQESGDNCGDCDFRSIKADEWYRFMPPLEKIVEVGSSEIADKCPEVGQCNGKNQIILSKSDTLTRHQGSWFYRIVWSKGGECRTLGLDKEHDLVEKNDCSGFYLYRFPQLFSRRSCGGGASGDPWEPTSICMDDSRSLSPFWVYLMVTVSCALLILIITFIVFSLYRHRQFILAKRRRSTHMYHQAAEGNRQSTHSYADLVTMGFQVSMPPPIHGAIPRDIMATVHDDVVDHSAVVIQNDLTVDPERNAGFVGADPLERVSIDGSFDSRLIQDAETTTNHSPRTEAINVTSNRIHPSASTEYLTPDELKESPRTLRLHSYMNAPKHDEAVPQINVHQDYMIPDELVVRPTTPLPLISTQISSTSSNFALNSLFSDSPSVTSPSGLVTSPGSQLRIQPTVELSEGETCCIDSCTECPSAGTHGVIRTPEQTCKQTDKIAQFDHPDPLSVSWSRTPGWRANSRNCKCRCSSRQSGYFRIQSV